MLQVDGFIVDIRTVQPNLQIQACAHGLITYGRVRRPIAARTG